MDTYKFKNSKLLHGINFFCSKMQTPFVYWRNKERKVYCTSALFSISRDFANYIVREKKEIEKRYKYSYVGEEIWIGSEIMNSSYADTVSEEDDLRYIDWINREGSSPHTFEMSDKDKLVNQIKNSNYIFARKFSSNRDMSIVTFIEEYLSMKR